MVITDKQETIFPLISIVVPVHQMSRKLGRLKSWVIEAPSCVEIILLHDDHDCDDATNSELQEIVQNTKTSKLFRNNWGNPGDARNFGKSVARGEWILFADSDDYLHILEVVACLLELVGTPSDCIIGQFELVKKGIVRPEETKKKEDVLKNLGNWRIVYRTNFISTITFPPLRMGEDQVFFCRILQLNPLIKIYGRTLYSYHTGVPGQLTSREYHDDMISSISLIESIFFSTKSNK